jgi:hypothetical protein
LLRSRYTAVGVVNDARNVLDTIERTRPDVVPGLSMPHVNGLGSSGLKHAPDVKVLVVTVRDRALADLAFRRGRTVSFRRKRRPAAQCAIDHVLSSAKPFISPRPRGARQDVCGAAPGTRPLTPRHRQILPDRGGAVLRDCGRPREHADRRFHRAGIRKALGISTVGLLRFAILVQSPRIAPGAVG